MEPTASVKSHHPSADVHGVVGESIVVVDRNIAPHLDEGPNGYTPSRVVPKGIRLRCEAARIYRQFDPASLEVPRSIPIGEDVSVWERRWIVRQSTLGRSADFGLFACDDILFDSTAQEETRPTLFPYVGSVYNHNEWLALVDVHQRGFSTYLLDVDSWRGSSMPREEYHFVDGDPVRCPNLAGYINNGIGTRCAQRQPNVMWVLIEDPSASYGRRDLEFHVATAPTRPIHAGDELLCHYLRGSGSLGTPCVFAPKQR
ncbi:hypothetical protein R1sor_015568 [Riccia sorocarpa]|uniref:SET domain-containing protein n=1 Tax=Riccia sorocarpa TaxID=122646 RepID=A0ABD3HGI7_9MARC